MTYYLYSLICPISNLVKYIGKTNNLRLRFNRHNSPSTRHRKDNWVRKLHKLGLKPIMIVINTFESEQDCLQAEVALIANYRLKNASLYNYTSGGESGYSNPCTLERKLYLSKILKERYANQEHHLKGRKLSSDHKDALKKAHNHHPTYGFKGKVHPTRQKIQIFKDNVLIDTLDSLLECAKKYDINQGSISNVLSGKAKTAKGYTFKRF